MKIFLALIAAALVALGLSFLFNAPVITTAGATDFYDPFSYHSTARRKVVYRKRARRNRGEELRYYAPVEPEWDEPGVRCIDKKVEVVSTEHTSVDNAREAGKKILMATIQWRYGGAYMDLSLAEEFREHCGPSNAMDNLSGRISEGVNKLIGQEGQNVRCVMRARPCRARLEKAEGHR